MSDADDVMYEHMLFGEHAPTEGLGGDRPYGPPTEVIELGKADGAGPEDPAEGAA